MLLRRGPVFGRMAETGHGAPRKKRATCLSYNETSCLGSESTNCEPAMTATSSDPQLAWARYMVARRVLVKVATVTRRARIDALAVKGVVTSGWLYADPSERLLTDVDLRIRPRDFVRFIALAQAEGWGMARCMWSYFNADLEVDGVQVDVEGTIGPPGLLALSVDAMLRRATLQPEGFWAPEIHDHALLMTINVFKDRLTQATPWGIEDLSRVVTAPYVERVHEARATGMAWIVADWMERTRGVRAWADIRKRLGGDRPKRWAYTRAVGAMSRGAPESLGLRVLMRAASDTPWRVPASLAIAGAWEVESRWDAWRRRR